MKVEYRDIAAGSALHLQELALRDAVLRRPLGVPLDAAELARDRGGRHFVALWHGKVVACAGLYPEGEGVLRLRHMAVLPALQGTGVGAGVLRFAETAGRDMGAARIETHARCTARGFYERAGYAASGAEFNEHTIPHILMRKTL